METTERNYMTLAECLYESSVRVKLERANQHLVDLMRDVEAMEGTERSRIVPKFNDEKTEVAFHLLFHKSHSPHRWAASVGDILNNLRSALDHMVYALSVAHYKKIPPPNAKKCQFPIANTKEKWKGVKRRIEGVSIEAARVIEAEQPYNRGDTPLARLHRLSNRDKHTVISVAPVAMTDAHFTNITNLNGKIVRVEALRIPLISDTPLLRIMFSGPNPDFRCDVDVSLGVLLNDERGWVPMIKSMTACRDEVVRILALLKPHLCNG